MKKLTALTLGSVIMMNSAAFAFSDLTESHWAYRNVMNMHEKGIISGFEDGTFRPADSLTREQFIAMAVKGLKIEKSDLAVQFEDISDRWSTDYILAAGYIISDEGDTQFKPSELALREDVAMALVRLNDLENEEYNLETLNNFSDKDNISENRVKYVAIAVESGFMSGNADGTFCPKNALSRAEGATVLTNFLSKISKNDNKLKINEIAPFIYDEAYAFAEGLAAVKRDGKWGYINEDGKEVITCKYDHIFDFKDGVAFVQQGSEWKYIDKDGTELGTGDHDTYINSLQLSEGLARARKDDKWGYVDKDGNEVIPFIYDRVYDFSEGMARVEKDNNFGFVDKAGNEIVPCVYDISGYSDLLPCVYKEGLAWIKKDGKYGYVDKTGTEVIPCIYDIAYNFSEGLALVAQNEKYEYIDKNGNCVISCDYENMQVSSMEDVINFKPYFYEGLVSIQEYGKYGYMDTLGRKVIPCIYDRAMNFSNGVAMIKQNGKWGYIDKEGNEVTSCIYDEATSFSNGVAIVKKAGKYGVIKI